VGDVGQTGSPRGARTNSRPVTVSADVSVPGQSARVKSRAGETERALISAGLDGAISHEFTTALVDVAVALEDKASKRSARSHDLCTLLADAADAIDVGGIASATGDAFARALVDAGVPTSLSSVIGWGVAKAAEHVLSSMMPGTQLCLGLRVLGLLVCPSPSGCPAQSRLSVPVFKALIASSPS